VLGDLTIPLMQFTLGVTLGRLSLRAIPRSLALSLLKIGMGVAVGVAVSLALGLEGIARGVFILDCAMPAAVFNYLLAQRYDRSPAEVASVVMMSTLVSLVTLPLVLAYVL
jgi:predicted permease